MQHTNLMGASSRDDLNGQAKVFADREEILSQIDGVTMVSLLQRNAKESPDAPAYRWFDDAGDIKEITWSEHLDVVARFASALRSLGVDRGDHVLIMLENRYEHVVADVACLFIGAVSTSLYLTFSDEQISKVQDQVDARIVVVSSAEQASRLRRLSPSGEKVQAIVVDDDTPVGSKNFIWSDLLDGSKPLSIYPDLSSKPNDPATIIFTSGTTGDPKGVVLPQSAVLYSVAAVDARPQALPKTIRYLSYLPLSHIAERLMTIYVPLWRASSVFFCPSMDELRQTVPIAKPTLFLGVPRVWEKFKAGIEANLASSGFLGRLISRRLKKRIQLLSKQRPTEPLAPSLLDGFLFGKVRQKLGLGDLALAASSAAKLSDEVMVFFDALGVRIYQGYGLTETCGLIAITSASQFQFGSVGSALAGMEIRIDEDKEVLVRGPALSQGYFKNQEATDALIDQEGWLHTGDLGTVDDDGFLHLIGRKKEIIVTSSGKNIAPENIEALIKEHSAVEHACVVGDSRPYLVALIVPSEEARKQRSADTLQQELGDWISVQNKAVSRIEQVKAFQILDEDWSPEDGQLTPTMKMRRSALAKRYEGAIDELYAG